jgi:hypothetical protein
MHMRTPHALAPRKPAHPLNLHPLAHPHTGSSAHSPSHSLTLMQPALTLLCCHHVSQAIPTSLKPSPRLSSHPHISQAIPTSLKPSPHLSSHPHISQAIPNSPHHPQFPSPSPVPLTIPSSPHDLWFPLTVPASLQLSMVRPCPLWFSLACFDPLHHRAVWLPIVLTCRICYDAQYRDA